MKSKKTLKNRIRGWLPTTPTLPQLKTKPTKIRSTIDLKLQSRLPPPPPPSPETKYQRTGGLAIGLCLGVLLVGAFGAYASYQSYTDVLKVLNYAGLETEIYVLRDVLDQTAVYLAMVLMGVYGVVYGALALRSRRFREISFNMGPYSRLGSGLMSGGGVLAFGSFRNLFIVLLGAHDARSNSIELQIFVTFFVIGVILMALGVVAYTRKAGVANS